MPDDPFLFDELADDSALSTSDEPDKPVYTSPIEQATFDIMELVDTYFRASVTVEEYDTMQKNVKKILLEAFDEKKPSSPGPGGRSLLLVPHDQD